MKKIIVALLVVFLLTFSIPYTVSADKTYHATSFNVDLTLEEGGSMLVSETVDFHFEGDPFTYAFREISDNETDGIEFLEASINGQVVPLGKRDMQVEVSKDDGLEVKWHFPPTANQTVSFNVKYRVFGVVRKGASDQIRWWVIPQDHDYTIETVNVTYKTTNGVKPTSNPSFDPPFESQASRNGNVLSTRNIPKDKGVILQLDYPANSLTTQQSGWQVREETRQRNSPAAIFMVLASGAAFLTLGVFGIIWFSNANRRDLAIPKNEMRSTLPDDTPPPIVGKLLGRNTYIQGILFELADRGIIELYSEAGFLGSSKYYLQLNPEKTRELKTYEKLFVEKIFDKQATRVPVSTLGTSSLYSDKEFNAYIDGYMEQKGWIDKERQQKKEKLILITVLLFIVGIALIILGGISLNFTQDGRWQIPLVLPAVTLGVGIGAFVVGFVLAIVAASFSNLTTLGEMKKSDWTGFTLYLLNVVKGKEPVMRADMFPMFLPLAAALGIGNQWAKAFQKVGGVELPVWFHTFKQNLHDSYSDFIYAMGNADSATSGDGGGGGGASGGGSSGAG